MNSNLQADSPPSKLALEVKNLSFFYGKFQGLKDISLGIAEKKVTAFIGPSGCGKSTLLRTFNRMYSLTTLFGTADDEKRQNCKLYPKQKTHLGLSQTKMIRGRG